MSLSSVAEPQFERDDVVAGHFGEEQDSFAFVPLRENNLRD